LSLLVRFPVLSYGVANAAFYFGVTALPCYSSCLLLINFLFAFFAQVALSRALANGLTKPSRVSTFVCGLLRISELVSVSETTLFHSPRDRDRRVDFFCLSRYAAGVFSLLFLLFFTPSLLHPSRLALPSVPPWRTGSFPFSFWNLPFYWIFFLPNVAPEALSLFFLMRTIDVTIPFDCPIGPMFFFPTLPWHARGGVVG